MVSDISNLYFYYVSLTIAPIDLASSFDMGRLRANLRLAFVRVAFVNLARPIKNDRPLHLLDYHISY